jgi:transmembrane sensor
VTAAAPSNIDIETMAAAFLRQQHFEAWTDQDRTRLTEWLAQSSRHSAAYWRLKAAWDQTERLAATRPARFRRPISYKPPSLPASVKAIAAVALIAAFGAGVFFWNPPAGQSYATGIGGHTTIRLADGSELDLGTNTAIRTRFDTGRRAVEVLKGEVFFRVTHNAARPFVVTAAGHRVIDLGTEFLVRTSPDAPKKLEVALIRGEARVESAGLWSPAQSATLHPGDVAMATPTSLNVTRKSSGQLADELAWRRGALVFHNTRLGDAVAEFNRYNETKLIVADRALAALTINGTFRTNGFEQFARVAGDVFGLHVRHSADGIVLTN